MTDDDLWLETRWLASTNPGQLLNYLPGKETDRKLRLFAIACCRSIWEMLVPRLLGDGYPLLRDALDLFERSADGDVSSSVHLQMLRTIDRTINDPAARAVWWAGLYFMSPSTAENVITALAELGDSPQAQLQKLRDVFGNPYRPVAVDPAWQTSNVTSLAQAIYTDRAFERMPILADALEDAGCSSREILDHCRQHGPHVRGCWVVDLILGKP